MMSFENKGFTASDIERYHSGQMSVEERHALEKATLDDPFLADALEGYTYTSTAKADLASIKARIGEKMESRNVVPFFKRYPWLSAAAVLIIIAGTGWFAFNNSSTEKTSIASTPPHNQEEKIAPPQKIVESKLADTTTYTVSNHLVVAPSKSQTKLQTASAYKSEIPINTANSGNHTQDEKNLPQDQETRRYKNYTETRSRTNPVRNNNVSRNEGEMNRGLVNNTGRNISPDPTVNYRNSQVSPQMNQLPRNNDSFRNDVANSKEEDQRQSAKDTINNVTVVMEPEKVNADEVIVLSKGAEKKSLQQYPKVTIDTLEPAEGYVKFDDYIARNLKMPEELGEKPITGEVELLFDVDKEGKPVNITVVRSLCDKCDEEAIRLLKEGPKWKRNRNKKGRISFKF